MSKRKHSQQDANGEERSESYVDRPQRRTAYLPVQIRKYRYLPFLKIDAHLVDISPLGLKLEFGRKLNIKDGDRFWVAIPQFDMEEGMPDLLLQITSRWYDAGELVLGGEFIHVDEEQRTLLEDMITRLKEKGRLPC